MRKHIRRLYLHLRYTPVATYMIGIIAAFGVERVLSQFSEQWGMARSLLSALAVFIIIWLLYEALLLVINQFLKSDPVPMGDKPQPRRALIMLLGGKSRESAPIAIEHHIGAVECVWLIVTDLTEPIVEYLHRKFPDVRLIPVKIIHHYRPEHAHSALRQAADYARVMNIPKQEIICDITGGTSAMTAGVIQGCLEANIDIEMVAAQYDPDTGEIKRAHDVILLPMRSE